MANLFSPNANDGDAVTQWTYTLPVPQPTDVYKGEPRAMIDINNVKRPDGKVVTVVKYNDPKTWTKGENALLAYLANAVASRTPGSEGTLPINPAYFPSGMAKFADWLRSAGSKAGKGIPTTIADLFDDVLYRDDSGEDPGPANPADASGSGLRMWALGEQGPPSWLGFRDKKSCKDSEERIPLGRWLTDVEGQARKQLVDNLPKGCCAIAALAASGVNHKDLAKLDPQKWVGVSVEVLKAFLEGLGRSYQIVDSLGRTICYKKQVGKGTTRLVVAAGHCVAFTSKMTLEKTAQHPEHLFKLIAPENLIGDMIKVCDKYMPLRGPYSVEVDMFANGCQIGPRSYMAALKTQENLSLDFNSAYAAILLNPSYKFPVPCGTEVIREYDLCEVERDFIKPHGFYNWETRGLHIEEKALLFNGAVSGWILGQVMLEATTSQQFMIRGDFVTHYAKSGKQITPEFEADMKELVLEQMRNDKQPVDKYPKCFYRGIVCFSGFLEKTESQKLIVTDRHESEVDYMLARSAQDLDYTVYTRDGEFNFMKMNHYRNTGVLAKKAVYCYMGLQLLRLWRATKQIDPAAQLEHVATDCLNVSTIARDLVIEKLTEASYIGAGLGQCKLQRSKPPNELCARRELGLFSAPSPMNLPSTTSVPLEVLLAALESGQAAPKMAIFGPPGSGKTTQILMGRVIPAIRKMGMEVALLTPYLTHAAILGCPTLASFLSDKRDSRLLAKTLDKVVVVIDEAGLMEPHQWTALRKLQPAGWIFLGDPYQLTRCGDLFDVIRRFRLPITWTDYHDNDRFGGSESDSPAVRADKRQRMHETLKTLDQACEEQRQTGAYRRPGPGEFPQGLEKKLRHVKFYESIENAKVYLESMQAPQGIHVCGFRHEHTDGDKAIKEQFSDASTVHALQGRTIGDQSLLITDYDCDPRLLRTALSRAVSIDHVAVVRRKEIRKYNLAGRVPKFNFA